MSVRIAGNAPGSTFADSGDELLATADGYYLAHHWTPAIPRQSWERS